MIKWLCDKINRMRHGKSDNRPIPKAGEEWVLCSRTDPWGGKKRPTVRIIDVKNGWVRYYMNRIFRDERKELIAFTDIYVPINSHNQSTNHE